MIVAVSDVHMGDPNSNSDDFVAFLNSSVIKDLSGQDHLVLLGDIMDMWYVNKPDLFKLCCGFFNALTRIKAKTYYIVGNHDYGMIDLGNRHTNERIGVLKSVWINIGGKRFLFDHGYYIEVMLLKAMSVQQYESYCAKMCLTKGGSSSELQKVLAGQSYAKTFELRENSSVEPEPDNYTMDEKRDFIKEFVLSPARDLFLGMKRTEVLVYGHMHDPFETENVVNTGAWLNTNHPYRPRGKENSYLVIKDDGSFTLKYY